MRTHWAKKNESCLLQHIWQWHQKAVCGHTKSSLVGLIFLNLPAMTSCVLGHVGVSDSARRARHSRGCFPFWDAENNAQVPPTCTFYSQQSLWICLLLNFGITFLWKLFYLAQVTQKNCALRKWNSGQSTYIFGQCSNKACCNTTKTQLFPKLWQFQIKERKMCFSINLNIISE
jgi:hypothetical protein